MSWAKLNVQRLEDGKLAVWFGGRRYNLHGKPGSWFVYALGHRVYGQLYQRYNHDFHVMVPASWEPQGKWAFILGEPVAEGVLERAAP